MASKDTRTAIHIEGGLFGPNFLDQLEQGKVRFQSPQDFGVKGSLQETISSSYEDARVYWRIFKSRLDHLEDPKRRGEVMRERWLRPFLGLLGYRIDYKGWLEAGGKKYPILYRADEGVDSPPVHIVPLEQELERAMQRGGRSPHGILQEYLNVSDDLWGIVTNGRKLRLLRKTPFVRRQAYVEVDLEALMEGDLPRNFALFFRLLHRSRLPKSAALADEAPIEVYYREALEQGERAREHLRELVEAFIKRVGTGFLEASENERRQELAEDPERFYQDLLRLTYRILFLLVAEGRNTLGGNRLYRDAFSISRLLRLSENVENFTSDHDLWHGLRALFLLLRENGLRVDGAPPANFLGLGVLNGQLFKPIRLEEPGFLISNKALLEAFRNLAFYYDEKAKVTRRVNYAALDVEELGSVYEGLLDHLPTVKRKGEEGLRFDFLKGDARKRTGSYYTPDELVGATLSEALDPVVEDRLAKAATPKEKEQAILSLKIVDPSAGSGHFLLGAARRLGRRLAQVRTGDEEPDPAKVREAVRDVIQNCIYGVDKNPMAVELCRVALWIESHVPGKPLTFLDHRIKVGDSLVGVLDPEVLKEGIPDGAFNPRLGEKAEKAIARALKRKNENERAGEQDLFSEATLGLENFSIKAINVAEALKGSDESASSIRKKEKVYASWREEPVFKTMKLASDLWTAAFFQKLKGSRSYITTSTVRRALAGQVEPRLQKLAEIFAKRYCFFHWWLEFPEVFLDSSGRLKKDAGFDVVIGNPPWERVKLQEKEFFAARAPEVANARNKAERANRIAALKDKNPALYQAYRRALADAAATSNFLHTSGRYPLTGRGDVNTYAVFAEHARNILGPGRSGMLVPTGIATDDTNKHFFAEVVDRGELAALLGFQNRENLFPDVTSLMTFSIFSLKKPGDPARPARLLFFATRVEHLADGRRAFTLTPDDFALLNPNTRTCPTFRTKADAELTKAIYRRVPVLIREEPAENPWGVRFLRMFDMSNDSHLFKTRAELEARGFSLHGNRFEKAGEVYLPLYEAKMIWQFDHRFATYDPGADRTRDTLPEEHADPAYQPKPRYWVPAAEVEARLEQRDREGRLLWRLERGWLLGFRGITNSTNERTAVFALVPKVGTGNSLPVIFTNTRKHPALLNAALLTNWSSLVLDYIAKLKIPLTNMNFHFVKQFPILPPSAYTPEDLRFLVPRVLELVYTAWDLAPFAQDVWEELADPKVVPPELAEDIRKELARRFAEHHGLSPEEARNDPRFAPPGWFQGAYPFPPFRWDEERRALIRAELDAYYARLYGLTREELEYILDPQAVKGEDFPGETFRVLKNKEIKKYGEYRTKRLVLEAWERIVKEDKA